MTTRLLDRSEWHRLREMWPAIDEVRGESLSVVVVELGGQIVACWGLITLQHVEGFWIRPEHRGRGGVLRALWRLMRLSAQSRGLTHVITGSDSTLVESLLTRMHAQRLPPQYLLPLQRAL